MKLFSLPLLVLAVVMTALSPTSLDAEQLANVTGSGDCDSPGTRRENCKQNPETTYVCPTKRKVLRCKDTDDVPSNNTGICQDNHGNSVKCKHSACLEEFDAVFTSHDADPANPVCVVPEDMSLFSDGLGF